MICSAEDNVHEYDYDEIRILLIIRMYFDDYNIGYEVTIYDYEYAWDCCDNFTTSQFMFLEFVFELL